MRSNWNEIEQLLQELNQGQQQRILDYGRRLVPHLTSDDVLQPNDFPEELENNPVFRYEEGVLAGIQTVQMALRAMREAHS